MSRIEQALEKAAQMRGPGMPRERVSPTPVVPAKGDPELFEASESRINKTDVDHHVISITDPGCAAAEEYKKLRARLFSNTDNDFANSLLVASSFGGEGKTLTAINLAVTMAREIDHTVLLIDADLRKPSVHTYLGLKPQPGLSDYLQNKVELKDVLIKTGIGKLVLLPAGTPPENPAELLASEKMRDLVREMKYRYRDRYIIFDSSPLLSAADGLYVKEYVDGVLFVVQAARTSADAAAEALSLLKGAHVYGVVFNNVPPELSANYGRPAYGYAVKAQKASATAVHAAGLPGNLQNSMSALLGRDSVRTTGQKIKTSMEGIGKWTRKK